MKSGLVPSHWLPVYIASKHAMIGYTTSCAVSSVLSCCPAQCPLSVATVHSAVLLLSFSLCLLVFPSCPAVCPLLLLLYSLQFYCCLFSLCLLVCLFLFVCLLFLHFLFFVCLFVCWGGGGGAGFGFLSAARQTFIAKERETGITCKWLCCCQRVVACVVVRELWLVLYERPV